MLGRKYLLELKKKLAIPRGDFIKEQQIIAHQFLSRNSSLVFPPEEKIAFQSLRTELLAGPFYIFVHGYDKGYAQAGS